MMTGPAPSTSRETLGRVGLIGATGFVGGVLARRIAFDAAYASRTIGDIAGQRFDTVVCAGAPAAMWKANADPDGDWHNLQGLIDHLSRAQIGRLVLISTIAVLADPAAGDDETSTAFETAKAYGRNRRRLEVALADRFDTHVLRLPALFGPGLKKNFLFDIRNPTPSFLTPERREALLAALPPSEGELIHGLYTLDEGLRLWALDRATLDRHPGRPGLDQAIVAAGYAATAFTHADSAFQYYGLDRLADDIDTAILARLPLVHMATQPWRVGDLHLALTGLPFENTSASVYREDMRTGHAAIFGGARPYLQSRETVLSDIRAFFAATVT